MESHYSFIVIGAITTTVILTFGYFLMGSQSSSKAGKKLLSTTPAASSSSSTKISATHEKNVVAEVKVAGPSLSIYFGSQTGTAEGFARIMMKQGKLKGFTAKMVDLEDFDPDTLANDGLAIFLMATYGEGEPTDNAAQFMKYLKNENDEVPSDFFAKLNFAVFGLGNKQYEHYNKMGKSVDSLVEKLGARRMFEYGEGDDDGSLEEDFETWKAKLWHSLIHQFLLSTGDASPTAEIAQQAAQDEAELCKPVELMFAVQLLTGDAVPTKFSERGRGYSEIGLYSGPGKHVAQKDDAKVNNSTKHFFTSPVCTVTTNRQLRSEGAAVDTGSTVHIELDIKHLNLRYETADNLALLPRNDEDNVLALAASLGYDLDAVLTLIPVPGVEFRPVFPTPCTVREALTLYFDIQGPPRHATVAALLPYVTDSEQKSWLTTLISPETRHAYNDTIHQQGKSLSELLSNELSSCSIPLSDFMNIAPFMQPRYYTISSSSSLYPTSVHITVGVMESRLTCGKTVRGVCSSYLEGLTPGSRCRVFVRPSSFRLPMDPSVPVVMIGPGTGIAPMRALLQERGFQAQQAGPGAIRGRNTLYFGCKHRAEDFIYSDELEMFQATGVLSSLHLAFSRDSKEKVYVQHLLHQPDNAAALVKDLDAGGYLFVCGATHMGNDVNEVLLEILIANKALTRDAALLEVKRLQESGRYVQELWSA